MEEIKGLNKICPNCETEMELEVHSYPMGSAFLLDRFHVDIYRCPNCDKVELFAAAKGDMVTCPVCGSSHSAKEKCAICALNTAFDGSHTKV